MTTLTTNQLTVLRNAKAGRVYRSERGHDLYDSYDRAPGGSIIHPDRKVTAIVNRLSTLGLLRIGEQRGMQRPWHVTEQGDLVLSKERQDSAPIYEVIARGIKTRVTSFSDRRLNDGDDVWRERELELRCSVAATANAIVVELLEIDPAFDKRLFAAACGLYVSDGRGDCYPGELTWEIPRPATKES